MKLDPRRVEVIDDATAARLRAMTPAQRLAMADAMYLDARAMITHRVRCEHGDWDEARVHAEVNRRMTHDAA